MFNEFGAKLPASTLFSLFAGLLMELRGCITNHNTKPLVWTLQTTVTMKRKAFPKHLCVRIPECIKRREAKREIAVYYTKITGWQLDNDKHNDITWQFHITQWSEFKIANHKFVWVNLLMLMEAISDWAVVGLSVLLSLGPLKATYSKATNRIR